MLELSFSRFLILSGTVLTLVLLGFSAAGLVTGAVFISVCSADKGEDEKNRTAIEINKKESVLFERYNRIYLVVCKLPMSVFYCNLQALFQSTQSLMVI